VSVPGHLEEVGPSRILPRELTLPVSFRIFLRLGGAVQPLNTGSLFLLGISSATSIDGT
jgi:hypothetical protein